MMKRITLSLLSFAMAGCGNLDGNDETHIFRTDIPHAEYAARSSLTLFGLRCVKEESEGDGVLIVAERPEVLSTGGQVRVHINPDYNNVNVRIETDPMFILLSGTPKEYTDTLFSRMAERAAVQYSELRYFSE